MTQASSWQDWLARVATAPPLLRQIYREYAAFYHARQQPPNVLLLSPALLLQLHEELGTLGIRYDALRGEADDGPHPPCFGMTLYLTHDVSRFRVGWLSE